MEGDKKSNRPIKGEADAPAAPGEDHADQQTSRDAGWDPYEVWRTRVLLPRQQATNEPQTLVSRRTHPDRHNHGPAGRPAPVAKPA